MQISLNSEPKLLTQQYTVLTFLCHELNQTEFQGIAVALNNSILPKAKWDVTYLKEGDQLLLVRAAQGG